MKQSVARTTERLDRAHLLLTLALISLTSCLNDGCVKRSYNHQNASTQSISSTGSDSNRQPPRININTASAEELEKLPGIGKIFAARIVEHRQKYGPFRKPEHLIIVRGISEHRFRELKDLITVE